MDASALQGYSYVKSNTVAGSPDGALQDYPVMLVVHSGYGHDDGHDVYLNGHSRSWPNDLRFTDGADVPLGYWIESSDPDSAVVWVKVGRIPASPGTAEIKLYYGKADDPGASSGSSTFLLFDDFKGDRLNGAIWTNITAGHGAIVNQQNGELDLSGGGTDPDRPLVVSNAGFNRGIMITATEKAYSGNSIAGLVLDWDGKVGGRWNSPDNAYSFEYCSPAREARIMKDAGGSSDIIGNETLYPDTEWHEISLGIDGDGGLSGWIDGSRIVDARDAQYTSGRVGLYGREQPSHIETGFRNVYVRKWTFNEPSPGAWGTEAAAQSSAGSGLSTILIVGIVIVIIALLAMLLLVVLLMVYLLGKRKK